MIMGGRVYTVSGEGRWGDWASHNLKLPIECNIVTANHRELSTYIEKLASQQRLFATDLCELRWFWEDVPILVIPCLFVRNIFRVFCLLSLPNMVTPCFFSRLWRGCVRINHPTPVQQGSLCATSPSNTLQSGPRPVINGVITLEARS